MRATPRGVGVAAFLRTGVALPSLDLGVGVIAPFLPARLLLDPINKNSMISVKKSRVFQHQQTNNATMGMRLSTHNISSTCI